jgi:transcription antitermination factor NusG
MGLFSPTRELGGSKANFDPFVLPTPWVEHHWYAIRTCSNHEKRVACELGARDIEHFFPVYASVRRWKDRRVTLDSPLFPGYMFVRLALRDRLGVLQIRSVVCLVGFGGIPAALPDEEMGILRAGLSERLRAQPHPFLTVGRRVRITGGPFSGLEGVLERKKNNLRVIVSVELIQRSVALDVDAADVAPAAAASRPLAAPRREFQQVAISLRESVK